jgi:hypothetical protein
MKGYQTLFAIDFMPVYAWGCTVSRDGHGIGWSLPATLEDHLKSGDLETILDPYARKLRPFYLYFPIQNKRVECLRLFIDCLVSHHDQA